MVCGLCGMYMYIVVCVLCATYVACVCAWFVWHVRGCVGVCGMGTYGMSMCGTCVGV